MSKTTLTVKDHGDAMQLAESIKLMACSLREEFLDEGAMVNDKTAEHALYAGLNLIAHAASTLSTHVEKCQMELERVAQKPGKEASHE